MNIIINNNQPIQSLLPPQFSCVLHLKTVFNANIIEHDSPTNTSLKITQSFDVNQKKRSPRHNFHSTYKISSLSTYQSLNLTIFITFCLQLLRGYIQFKFQRQVYILQVKLVLSANIYFDRTRDVFYGLPIPHPVVKCVLRFYGPEMQRNVPSAASHREMLLLYFKGQGLTISCYTCA